MREIENGFCVLFYCWLFGQFVLKGFYFDVWNGKFCVLIKNSIINENLLIRSRVLNLVLGELKIFISKFIIVDIVVSKLIRLRQWDRFMLLLFVQMNLYFFVYFGLNFGVSLWYVCDDCGV